jgi:hypothetical protein
MEEHGLRAFQNRFKGDLDLRDRKKETQLKTMDNEDLSNVYPLQNNLMRGSTQRKRKWVR